MNNLFAANFTRLKKSMVFWLCSLVMFVYIVIYMLNGCRQQLSGIIGEVYSLEDYYFQFAMLIGLFVSVFITLFLSTEYSDGVIRNKIIAGHTRRAIYLSNLFTVFLASLFIMLMGLLGGLVGIPVFGLWKMDALSLVCRLLILAMFLFAFCAIFTLINMLSQNRAFSAVITVLTFFALLMAASMIINRLAQPEMVSDALFTADGLVFSDPMPNPYYVSGTTRKLLDFIVDLIPAGQGQRLAINEAAHPLRMILSSAFVTVFATLCGLFLFEKRDLK
ncbi:MAG: ABC transporter permease [Lachnospiraceae bacterium]|nr:ABC transporter permease [Lachnospiraceae bacterium]